MWIWRRGYRNGKVAEAADQDPAGADQVEALLGLGSTAEEGPFAGMLDPKDRLGSGPIPRQARATGNSADLMMLGSDLRAGSMATVMLGRSGPCRGCGAGA